MKLYVVLVLWQVLLLFFLIIQFVNETDAKLGHAGWAKSDSRTKQLLQNIRSHIAQQEEQQVKECDPKTSPCNVPDKKEADDDNSEEVESPEHTKPFRFRGRQRTATQPKKDVTRAAMKDRKSMVRKKENETDEPKKVNKKTKDRSIIDDDDHDESKKSSRKVIKLEDEDKLKKSHKKISKEKDDGDKVNDKEELEDKTNKPTNAKEYTYEMKKKKSTETPKLMERVKREEEREDIRPIKILSKRKSDSEDKKKQPLHEKTDAKAEIRQKKQKHESKGKENVQFPDDVPVFSLISDTVKSEQCKKHSRVYLRQLKRYKLWALMMYDATAKLPSGILQGNVNQYGDFDQCISVNASFKQHTHEGLSGIQGKYCLATIDVSSDSEDAGLQHAIHRSQSFGFVRSKIYDPGHFIPRFSTINWGLCIPSACKAEDLESSIKASLHNYKKKSGISFDVKVEDKNCVTKEDLLSDYDMKTLLTLLFYAAIITVAAYATLKDTPHKHKKLPSNIPSGEAPQHEAMIDRKNKTNDFEDDETNKTLNGKLKSLIMAFSLKRNVKKLFIEEESEDSIDCIHGIKSIFTVMLYFAHKTIPLALTPFSNRVVLTEISNEAPSTFFRGSVIYTDSFLLISGVLTSFNLGKEIKKTGRILWIQRIIARYIRLTPALLATLLFYAYISNYLGSGPLWNVVVKENARLCQLSLWRNLLYIQNFYPFEEMCAPQTHQLALDMQLFLLSPLLVYLLHKYDKIGIGILQALLMVSSILRFITTKSNELSLFIFHGMSISQLYTTANLVYSQPIYRATPYIVGVITGYYLQKAGKDFKLPKPIIILGWLTSSCLALTAFTTPAHLAKQTFQYNTEQAAHYAALIPIAWSAALAWLITACYLGYGGKLNEYLSCRGFLVFSKISYSVYLLQFLVFSHRVGSKKVPEIFSVLGSIDIVEFLIVLFISASMTLLLDIPTVEIKRVILSLFPGWKQNENKTTVLKEKEEEDIASTDIQGKTITPTDVGSEVELSHENKYTSDRDEKVEDKYDKLHDVDMEYPEDELLEEPEEIGDEIEYEEEEEVEDDENINEPEISEDLDELTNQADDGEPDFWADQDLDD